MNPHNLSQTQYNLALYQILLMLEESGTPKTEAYTDDKGIPTIGVGINLRTGHIAPVLQYAFNIVDPGLTAKLQTVVNRTWAPNLHGAAAKPLNDQLNRVMSEYRNTHPDAPATFSLTVDQIGTVFNALVSDFDKSVNDFLARYHAAALGPSLEKLALVSLGWNSPGVLLGKGLGMALAAGNRAEAWYEIRYGSNGGTPSGGVAKRRYMESNLFGLYDGINPTDEEAKQTYAMLTEHRAGIQSDEATWSRVYLAVANSDYTTLRTNMEKAQSGLGTVLPSGQVPTLQQALKPAADILISEYGQGQTFSVLNIFMAQPKASEIGRPSDVAPDLIIGDTGNDTLTGGAGDDVLVDGGGNNTFKGGAGKDKYVHSFQDQSDVIVDSDGKGTVLVQNSAGGSLQLKGGGTSVNSYSWNDVNTGVNYQFSPATSGGNIGNMAISGGLLSAGQIVIKNFDLNQAQKNTDGYLGIHFAEKSQLVSGIGGNTFDQGKYDPADVASRTKDIVHPITVYASAISDTDQQVTISMDGSSTDYMWNLGDGFRPGGDVTLTIPAGSDSVTVGLMYTGTSTDNQTVHLSSALVGVTDTPASNNLTVTFDRSNPVKDLNSDLFAGLPQLSGLTSSDGLTTTYDGGNTGFVVSGAIGKNVIHLGDGNNSITGGNDVNDIHVGDGNNNITVGSGNDGIVTAGGNSVINAGGGKDTIYVGGTGGGDNLINLNGGHSIVYAGNGQGHTRIYGNTKVDIPGALSQAAQATASGAKGNFIVVGTGDSTIVGGTGNDVMLLGNSNALVIAGPGDDTIEGGMTAGGVTLDWGTQRVVDGNKYLVKYTNAVPFNAGGYAASSTYDGNLDGDGKPVGAGNATIFGGTGNHTIALGNGNNYVDAGSGNSSIWGGNSNDTIFGGTGNVLINGGGGDDYIDAESGADKIYGGAGNNIIYGGSGNSTIYAGMVDQDGAWAKSNNGNNYVESGTGNTLIFGSGGNDTLVAGTGSDTIYGGDGNLTIEGGSGSDQLWGGAGTDVIYAGDGGTEAAPTQVVAGTGDTTIYGGDGVDHLFGGDGNNVIYMGDGGTAAAPTEASAGKGNTTIYGGGGVDLIQGGAGTNVLYAGDGGTAESPTIVKIGSGNTTVYGGVGVDQIIGGAGTNVIHAGDGGDVDNPTVVQVGSGNATVYGGTGVDQITGGAGTNVLYAGDGGTADNATVVRAGSGDATLVGGAGNSHLVGGSGHDTFVVGSGTTTIFQSKAGDVISLGDDANVADLTVSAQLYDDGSSALVIEDNSGGTTNVMGGLSGGANSFALAGGSTLNLLQLMQQATITPQDFVQSGSELMLSSDAGDVLIGGDGNDTIYGFGANDTLMGGAGSSKLVGGGGNATFAVNANGGKTTIENSTNSDTLQLGDGISVTDIVASSTTAGDGLTTVSLKVSANGANVGAAVTVSGNASGMLSKVAFADGSSTTLSQLVALSSGGTVTIANPDGGHSTIVNDGHGNVTTTVFGSDGAKTSDAWTKADGSHGSEVFNSDGSSSGNSYFANGTSTTYANDGKGNAQTINLNSAGLKTSDSWTASDGSSGSDTFDAAGARTSIVKDAQGNTTTTLFNALGVRLSDTWSKADGSSGSDTFNSDGSSAGSGKGYSDGTMRSYVDDGKGNRTERSTLNGTLVSDSWSKEDGTHGNDFFNSDGSANGTLYAANGSYSTYVNDGHGNITTTNFDAQGRQVSENQNAAQDTSRTDHADGSYDIAVTTSTGDVTVSNYDSHGAKVSDSWSTATGGHGTEVINTDGSSSGVSYKADGSRTEYSGDGKGHLRTVSYDWNGHLTGSTISTANGLNNSVTSFLDSAGVKIQETWIHADGSSGIDLVGPLDFNGALNIAPVSGRQAYGTAGDKEFTAKWTLPGGYGETDGLFNANGTWSVDAESWFNFSGTSKQSYIINQAGSASGSNPIANFEIFDAVTGVDFLVNEYATDVQSEHTAIKSGLNGTYSILQRDGMGNVAVVSYAASGAKIDDIWLHNDGSQGADQFNADGTSVGFVVDAYGKVVNTTNGVVTQITNPVALPVNATNSAPATITQQSAPVTLSQSPTSAFQFSSDNRAIEIPGGGFANNAAPDGKGGSYAYKYGAGGSVQVIHVDATAQVISGGTVDTDPGYELYAVNNGKKSGWHYDVDGTPVSSYLDDGHGTVTTRYYDGQGRGAGYSVAVTNSQGAISSKRYDQAGHLISTSQQAVPVNGQTSTTFYDDVGHVTGSSLVVVDGKGNAVTSNYGANNVLVSTSTSVVTAPNEVTITSFDATGKALGAVVSATASDGTIQTRNYDANGKLSGSVVGKVTDGSDIAASNYGADGKLTGYVTFSLDSAGNTKVAVYGASGTKLKENTLSAGGAEVGTVQRADGTSLATTRNADQSYSTSVNDGKGKVITTNYNAQNAIVGDSWTAGDGSSGKDIFNADGTASGTVANSDGSSSSYIQDAHGVVTASHYAADGRTLTGTTVTSSDAGKITAVSYGANGVKLGDAWSKTDGSSGGDTFAADDSYSTTVRDARGNSMTTSFTGKGTKTGDIWRKSDGSHGTDMFALDGSSSGSVVNADKTSSTYTDDGHGSKTAKQYDANGVLLGSTSVSTDAAGNVMNATYDAGGVKTSDSWTKVDGSKGSDTYSADGTSTSTVINADGSTLKTDRNASGASSTATDSQGNVVITQYDPEGVKTSDTWTKKDGSHGSDTYSADGSSAQQWNNCDGSYGRSTDDGKGNTSTSNFNADGSSTVTTHNADGSYSVSTDDGHGSQASASYDLHGAKILATWHKSDGSYGGTTFNSDGSGTVYAFLFDATGKQTGSRSGTINADGSSSITLYHYDTGNLTGYDLTEADSKGNSLVTTYDSQGNRTGEHWTRADGSSGAGDGSYSVTASDGQGGTFTTQYSIFGTKSGDTWTKADGSSGSDVFNIDGSSSGNVNYADGTSQTYSWNADGSGSSVTLDAHGNAIATHYAYFDGGWDDSTASYDANGFKTGDTWHSSNGWHGVDTYNPDGSSTSIRYQPDGSWTKYVSPDYNSDQWTQSDGTHGSDVWGNDGSHLFTAVQVDGSYSTDSLDALGNQITTQFDKNGNKLSDTWTNADGSSGSDTFEVVNHAPLVNNPITSQQTDETKAFRFAIPDDTFTDIDAGDTLVYSAALSNGTALPSWLSFDSGSRTFTGTPAHGDIGHLHITVTATDQGGLSASSTFDLEIAPPPAQYVTGNTMYSAGTIVLPAAQQNLTGTGSDDISLTGNSAANVITANDGNDTLIAGSGLATLVGGAGNDTFVVNNAHDVVVEHANNGNNTVLTSVSYVLPDYVQNLTGTGGGNLTLTGNSLSNVITANNGNDILIAGSGLATLVGGVGNDTFKINNVGDVVLEQPNHGKNTVVTSVSYALPANVQNITGTGSGDLKLSGNDLNNIITGNAGHDTLVAGTGNATLIAGAGIATMVGGVGNDVFVINNVNDVILEQANHGKNLVRTSVSYVLPANVQNITATGSADVTLTGNDMNNVITGNAGNDVLIAGEGNDTLVAGSGIATMFGGSGDDVFKVNNVKDVVIKQPNSGKNTVITSVSYSLPANVQNITASGSDSLTLTGNNLNNVIRGNSGNDTLIAGDGNDTLISGAGVTAMTGGAGNDVFYVNNAADVITKQSNTGKNMVITSVSYVLPENIQNITGSGKADLTLTGNSLNNVITGNAGHDTLVAGSGDATLVAGAGLATLIGGHGHNTYKVNNSADVIDAQADALSNNVFASVSYTLTGNLRNLTLTGNAALTATGGDLGGTITGNAGNDTLVGGAGDDTLIAGSGVATLMGGAGNDTYKINNAADVITEAPNTDVNSVLTTVSYVLPANVQNLTGTGSGDLTLTGNDLNNVITGNAGHDTLVGGTGNSTLVAGSGVATMIGGSGDNTFKVNNVADVVTQKANSGLNTIISSVSYVAPDNVQDLLLTGAASLTATGNGGNNLIVANSGNDTLIGGAGVSVLEGRTGRATLRDTGGSGALLGGSNNDTIVGGTGAAFIDGGAGNDAITLGAGTTVLAFNAGGGKDTVTSGTSTGNTLSLGGGIAESNLTLSKSGNNLVLNTGGDSITLSGWYASAANHQFSTLQLLEQSSGDYDPNSTNPLINQAVEQFDFSKLVAQFDQARAKNPSMTSWSVMNGLLDAHLSSSGGGALGGDLAYYDGTKGSLAGMDMSAAVSTLQDLQFGKAAQAIHAWTAISQSANTLR